MSFEFCQLDERFSESQEYAQKFSQNFKLLNSIIGVLGHSTFAYDNLRKCVNFWLKRQYFVP